MEIANFKLGRRIPSIWNLIFSLVTRVDGAGDHLEPPSLSSQTSNPPPTKPRRRWLQYSLRSLFVLTAICALASYYVSSQLHQYYIEQDCLKELTKAGIRVTTRNVAPHWLQWCLGSDRLFFMERVVGCQLFLQPPPTPDRLQLLSHLSQLETLEVDLMSDSLTIETIPPNCRGTLREFYLSGSDLTDQDLAGLEQMKSLEFLTLDSREITDQGLKGIAGLTKLRYLSVEGTQLTDERLADVAKLGSLEALDISGTQVTDEGVKLLTKIKALRRVTLGSWHIHARSAETLAALSWLTDVRITTSDIDDGAVKQLTHLRNLQVLELWGAGLSDDGVKLLQKFKKLEYLCLVGSRVSNECAKHLIHLSPSLKEIDLRDSRFGVAGEVMLESARPNLKLLSSPDRIPSMRKLMTE